MRAGGFADVETTFDGNTLTVLGKDLNIYAQQDVPGTIDHLIDELRSKHGRHLLPPVNSRVCLDNSTPPPPRPSPVCININGNNSSNSRLCPDSG